MAVKYILQQQKYDMSGNGSNFYFAKAVPIGEVDLKPFARTLQTVVQPQKEM